MRFDRTKAYEEHWPCLPHGGRYFQAGRWFRDDFSEVSEPKAETPKPIPQEEETFLPQDTLESVVAQPETESSFARMWRVRRALEARGGVWDELPKKNRVLEAERILAGG